MTTQATQWAIGMAVVSRRRPVRRGVIVGLTSSVYQAWLYSRSLAAAHGGLEMFLRYSPEPSNEPDSARVKWNAGRTFRGAKATCSAWVKLSSLLLIEGK